ncbi:hypothetical protein MLD38_000504 [Melastoma candidum]|uniref:Uncharacterized protein n=1 Tax=Melastoma candidum TaxID=119954 RepID=A0ACB9SIY1_9MYRT|nr:hypothetical protein MLD38_000504 [Melastoma candidum]
MAEIYRVMTIEDLPLHLILEILSCGRLGAVDLVSLELSSKMFRGSQACHPLKFQSLVDLAACQMCESHPVYRPMSLGLKKELFERCQGNWKRLLRFLHMVEQSSGVVETSSGNMQVTTGKYHTLLLRDSAVYSCGSSLCGVLGQNDTQCVTFTPISFSFPVHVFTWGDNSSYCCGHREPARVIPRPRLVEALKDIPCDQVASGLNFTVFLTREGQVYTCGSNTYGQLGHGDTLERPVPKVIEQFDTAGPVVQVAAGPSYALAVMENGAVCSFGSGSNFCLGHGEQHNEFQPRMIQSFRRRGIHVVRVSAGDDHVVALDSNGQVYTWGKGYCGALGHGDEIDKVVPELAENLKSHLAVQVCARKRKTFVLIEHGYVFGFGWMAFGSLGFPDRGASDKVLRPRILSSLRTHRISQISTGLYHTVVVTNKGRMFGFGDNERAQLGHDMLRACLEPTEIFVQQVLDQASVVS